MKISLKPNEKIYVNGAVIRADRKVSIEFLNDVQFLLENHVLQADDASTPLRQLYFLVQVILIEPDQSQAARAMFKNSLPLLFSCFSDSTILAGLKTVDRLVVEGEIYEALKTIRGLYPIEARIINDADLAADTPILAMAAGE